MNVEQETLGLRRGGFSPPLSLLMSAFALLIPPASFTRHLRRPTERSPTICASLKYTLNHLDQLQPLWPLHDLPRKSVSSTLFTSFECTLRMRISAASVTGLAPLHLPRRTTRSVSYYAFFKGWLLLSQPPDCFSLPTSFST